MTRMSRNERRSEVDPYVYPGTHTLRNKADLRESEALAAHESRMVFKRVLRLYAEPRSGTLNVAHLPAIHHTLFQDVYSWVGRFRTGNMSIGGKMFCQAGKLETSLDLLLHQFTKEQTIRRAEGRPVRRARRLLLGRAEHHPSFPRWQWQNAARVHPSTRAAGTSQGTVGTKFEVRDGQCFQAVFRNQQIKYSGVCHAKGDWPEPLKRICFGAECLRQFCPRVHESEEKCPLHSFGVGFRICPPLSKFEASVLMTRRAPQLLAYASRSLEQTWT